MEQRFEKRKERERISPQGIRTLDSGELFGRGSEIRIHHGPDEYRLRITRQGKLILTK